MHTHALQTWTRTRQKAGVPIPREAQQENLQTRACPTANGYRTGSQALWSPITIPLLPLREEKLLVFPVPTSSPPTTSHFSHHSPLSRDGCKSQRTELANWEDLVMLRCEGYNEEGTPDQFALGQKYLLLGSLKSLGKNHTPGRMFQFSHASGLSQPSNWVAGRKGDISLEGKRFLCHGAWVPLLVRQFFFRNLV